MDFQDYPINMCASTIHMYIHDVALLNNKNREVPLAGWDQPVVKEGLPIWNVLLHKGIPAFVVTYIGNGMRKN